MPDPTPNPMQRIAGVIADMLAQNAEPIVSGRPMHRATMCELADAIRDESVTLGMHKAQYPFDDRRVVSQVAKVGALVDHLKERMECA
jgi:hypothetical protein